MNRLDCAVLTYFSERILEDAEGTPDLVVWKLWYALHYKACGASDPEVEQELKEYFSRTGWISFDLCMVEFVPGDQILFVLRFVHKNRERAAYFEVSNDFTELKRFSAGSLRSLEEPVPQIQIIYDFAFKPRAEELEKLYRAFLQEDEHKVTRDMTARVIADAALGELTRVQQERLLTFLSRMGAPTEGDLELRDDIVSLIRAGKKIKRKIARAPVTADMVKAAMDKIEWERKHAR